MVLSVRTDRTPLRTEPDGSVRVGKSRVLLATVIGDFRQGATPEEIVVHFPTLDLADVYAVLGYYLRHRAEVDRYLSERERRGEQLRERIESESGMGRLHKRLLARKAAGGQSSD